MFDSQIGLDDLMDEQMIDDLFTPEWAAKFHQAKGFQESRINYGGPGDGIWGIPCRTVIILCEGQPDKLAAMLGLRTTQKNLADMAEIIELCQHSVNTSAYLA